MTKHRDGLQLSFSFDVAPRTADELLEVLRSLGLRGITNCRITENRAVMVSHGNGVLRVHRAYLSAPSEVLRAIALFVCARTRVERHQARKILLAFSVPLSDRVPARRKGRSRPGDERLIQELAERHREYNARLFGAELGSIEIHVSHRMRRRLGQYTAASPAGDPAEISIARSHIRRHDWRDVLHTLLHEMVHQWQAETGKAIGHGRSFRDKAREVGISPLACREMNVARKNREVTTRAARSIL